MKEFHIDDIEALTEAEAKEMAEDMLVIKEHNCYFIDFKGYFGYSVVVFKNNHQIDGVNDYELHHKDMTKEEMRKRYIDRVNHMVFTESEIAEPIKDYTDYQVKSYYLHNYYAEQVDNVSMFHIFRNDEEEAEFDRKVKGMYRNNIGFCYTNDLEFNNRHWELNQILEKRKDEMKNSYDYWYKAFLHEMWNHEYGINYQGNWDVLSCFYNGVKYNNYDDYNAYFKQLNMPEVQQKAYRDARKEYFRVCEEKEYY